jgi:CubicO group peptidase (beta-lactamase class C family)
VTASVPLPRSTPEEQGIPSSAITGFIAAADTTLDSLNSFMLLRHGFVVAEGWWHPYAADHPHMMFSVSKSFTSTAVGLAIEDGLLTLDDHVVDLLTDDLPPDPSERLRRLTVRHLLTMSSGHAIDTATLGTGGLPDAGWVRSILATPLEFEPGTRFVYNSGATHLLAAILTRLTGERLLDYLTPRLLEPLGIRNATWEQSPEGVDAGGWGLNITTEDLALFGQLLLQRGEWNGRQLVPAAWIDESTALQIDTTPTQVNTDWVAGYAYQYWRNSVGGFRADGAFGNFAIVLPELDAVVVLTSSLPDAQPALDLVWEHLLPALGEQALPANPADAATLKMTLRRLEIWTPQGAPASPAAARVDGIRFVFDSAELSDLTLSGNMITTTRNGLTQSLPFGEGDWETSPAGPIAAAGAWTAPDTLLIRSCLFTGPWTETLTLTFGENTIELEASLNVSFDEMVPLRLTGRAA